MVLPQNIELRLVSTQNFSKFQKAVDIFKMELSHRIYFGHQNRPKMCNFRKKVQKLF